jgi:hypothetical protein
MGHAQETQVELQYWKEHQGLNKLVARSACETVEYRVCADLPDHEKGLGIHAQQDHSLVE